MKRIILLLSVLMFMLLLCACSTGMPKPGLVNAGTNDSRYSDDTDEQRGMTISIDMRYIEKRFTSQAYNTNKQFYSALEKALSEHEFFIVEIREPSGRLYSEQWKELFQFLLSYESKIIKLRIEGDIDIDAIKILPDYSQLQALRLVTSEHNFDYAISLFQSYLPNITLLIVNGVDITELRMNAELAFQEAMVANTLLALENYRSEWWDYASYDIRELLINRIKELQPDTSLSAPILNNPDEATQEMIYQFFNNYPGHIDEDRIKVIFECELPDLVAQGLVSVSINGGGIERATVTLTNNTNRVIFVTIPLGVYFASVNEDVQDMVVRLPVKNMALDGNGTNARSVWVACMNIYRRVPGNNDILTLKTLTDERLLRVMELCLEQAAGFEVTQAAIWIVMDNPSDDYLRNRLVNQSSTPGSIAGNAISREDLAKAKSIVLEADTMS